MPCWRASGAASSRARARSGSSIAAPARSWPAPPSPSRRAEAGQRVRLVAAEFAEADGCVQFDQPDPLLRSPLRQGALPIAATVERIVVEVGQQSRAQQAGIGLTPGLHTD